MKTNKREKYFILVFFCYKEQHFKLSPLKVEFTLCASCVVKLSYDFLMTELSHEVSWFAMLFN